MEILNKENSITIVDMKNDSVTMILKDNIILIQRYSVEERKNLDYKQGDTIQFEMVDYICYGLTSGASIQFKVKDVIID